MGAAFGGDEGVDLVDDDGFDGAEGFACVGGEEEIEGFGGGDENVAGMFAETGAFGGGGVAGADGDFGDVNGNAHALGHVGNTGEGGAEVAFDVDGEGFEGGDVDDADAGAFGEDLGLFDFLALAATRVGCAARGADLPGGGGERRCGRRGVVGCGVVGRVVRRSWRDANGAACILQHELIEAPKEGGEGFAGAGGGED